jgi:hypothetical protein
MLQRYRIQNVTAKLERSKKDWKGKVHGTLEVTIRVNTGTSDMSTINSSDRITATLYFLRTLFVSGIYV